MYVELRVSTSDWGTRHSLWVDGEHLHSIGALSECPEDAIIGRDLIDGHNLIAAIRLGYEAGKRGDQLIVSETAAPADEDL